MPAPIAGAEFPSQPRKCTRRGHSVFVTTDPRPCMPPIRCSDRRERGRDSHPAPATVAAVIASGRRLDFDFLWRDLSRLRHRHGQHAIGEFGIYPFAIRAFRQEEGPLEFTVAPLGQMISFLLFLTFLPFLAPDDESIARQ